MNIKKYLSLQFSLIVGFVLLVFSLFVYQNSSMFRHNEFYERLKEKGFAITELLLEQNALDTSVIESIENNNLNVLYEQRIFIYDKTFKLIYRNPKEYNEPDKKHIHKLIQDTEVEFAEGEIEFAGFVFKHPKGKFYVLIGALDVTGIKKIDFLRTMLIQIFIFSFLVTGFLGWIFASRALKPMVNVIDEVDKITATNLHKRVPVSNTKDEITHLSNTFNKMLDRLEGSFAMQKNFVANASHEFRTPLTSMKGQIDVMLMQNRTEAEYIKTLKSVNEDINNLIELLQGLSELAKITAEFNQTNVEDIPIVDLILDARSELIKSKPKYSIEIAIKNFSDDEVKTHIIGNTALLKSALSNLMDNACKFSPLFKVKVEINFEDPVIIKFIDEGIGISEKDMKHIFEPFYRGNDTRNIIGHGIGLSLVKRIIEMHQGTIKVESKQGQGTIFTISFNSVLPSEAI